MDDKKHVTQLAFFSNSQLISWHTSVGLIFLLKTNQLLIANWQYSRSSGDRNNSEYINCHEDILKFQNLDPLSCLLRLKSCTVEVTWKSSLLGLVYFLTPSISFLVIYDWFYMRLPIIQVNILFLFNIMFSLGTQISFYGFWETPLPFIGQNPAKQAKFSFSQATYFIYVMF